MTAVWLVIPPGGESPPVFYRLPSPEELRVLRHQGGKSYDPGRILGVPRSCPWGFPQVVLCRPLSSKGPFPTTFWMTCPHLSRLCGRAEADGGVRALEARIARDPERMRRHHLEHARLRGTLLSPEQDRFLRLHRPAWWRSLRSRGLGGIAFLEGESGGKCLHLHVASWLGWGHHPYASWLAAVFPVTHCDSPRCGRQ